MTPPDYVKNQFENNYIHKNGQIESLNEEACDYAKELCKFLIQNRVVPSSILDLGCRTGYAMDTFQEHLPNARVVGVDIVPEFIEIARHRGEVYEADMHALPFANGEFDWVFCTGVIEHAHDAYQACLQMFRVAKYGVFVSADVAPRDIFDKNPSHYSYKAGPTDWIKDMIPAQGEEPWQLISLKMPYSTVADMLWASPDLYKKLQEPL